MTEKTEPEVGPIVAWAMIGIGIAVVAWAVATQPVEAPKKPVFTVHTGTTAASLGLPPDPKAVSDTEWEETLVDVEKLKTDGVVTDVNASSQIATVSADKWNALSDDRKREAGRHLAIYCGRVSGTDDHRVQIKDESGASVGAYERN
jgi:hypothetical protein